MLPRMLQARGWSTVSLLQKIGIRGPLQCLFCGLYPLPLWWCVPCLWSVGRVLLVYSLINYYCQNIGAVYRTARPRSPHAYRSALLRPPVLNAPPRALLASAVPSLPPYCFSSPDI